MFETLASAEVVTELPIPAFFYGVIAMGVFLLLGWITLSYRDVANRHDHKVGHSDGHH